MKTTHHFETILSKLFDHLYGNADNRTSGAIEEEIRKIIQVGIYMEKRINAIQPAFYLTADERNQIRHSASATASYAQTIRKYYTASCKIYSEGGSIDSIKLSDYDLVHCCCELSEISFADNERDLHGDSVELFRSHWSKSQGGQFFTDQRVTALAIDLLGFDGNKDECLVDLCAGTGGFLIAALKRLKKNSNGKKNYDVSVLNKVRGYEADESVQSVGNDAIKTLTTKKNKCIGTANSLLLEKEESSKLPTALGNISHAATNPPFGAKILVKDPSILQRFELSKQNKQNLLKPLPLDVLFIEQNYNILKEGGKLAIILPFQTLSGPQSKWIRRWMLDRFRLLAVVDLPSETFQPYTGTKTSLVVVEKAVGGIQNQMHKIFMSCPQHIGHDRRGNPVWKKDSNGNEIDEIYTDIPQIGVEYSDWSRTNKNNIQSGCSFTVLPKAILENSDLRIDARFYLPSNEEKNANKLRAKSNYEVIKLGDLCEKIFYPGRFRRSYTDEKNNSVPFLGGTNISQLILATEKRIAIDDPNYHKLAVKAGWILITRSGSTGIVSIVADDWDGYAISEHVIRIVPDKKKIDSNYLYAFLQTEVAQDYIRRGVFGSVIDELSPDYLEGLDVFVPKNGETLKQLTRLVKNGLQARNEAIQSLSKANAEINKLLSL